MPQSSGWENSKEIRAMSAYDEFKGKVRQILAGGKRAQIARSHSVWEIENGIEDLKVGDVVVCNSFRTLRKFDDKQKNLKIFDFENRSRKPIKKCQKPMGVIRSD